jgi:predicted  nucleic acid-binding Zn-ribbon protein
MPHICTRCNNVFDSGEDILKGCPSCGWKKFMFVRKMPRESDITKHSEEQIITRAMGVRVPPRRSENESLAADMAMPVKAMPTRVDHAPSPKNPTLTSLPTQAPAKFEDAPQSESVPSDGKPGEGKGEGKALESIKITAPGTYELNLPSLFERDELIMAVKEGTYFIDLTSAFKKSKKD